MFNTNKKEIKEEKNTLKEKRNESRKERRKVRTRNTQRKEHIKQIVETQKQETFSPLFFVSLWLDVFTKKKDSVL